MSSAAKVRCALESVLGSNGAMQLLPRLVCPGLDTSFVTLDSVLRGGFPVAGTVELTGERSSGRATVTAAYVAERTREGHLCAWIDVGHELDGDAFAANGGDLQRLLVVHCLGELERVETSELEVRVTTSGARTSFRKDKTIGTPGVQNRMFVEPRKRVAVAGKVGESVGRFGLAGRVEPVDTDRQPARRGLLLLERREDDRVVAPVGRVDALVQASGRAGKAKKPWGRLEQAIKAVDLLIQAGGFGVIVLDLGSLEPKVARRIPLATWFRWRAALERTRTSLMVLSRVGCVGSAAELVLRAQAEVPEAGAVLRGGGYRLEVVRRRFAEVEKRKGPQPAGASAWASRAGWRAV